MAVHLDSGLKAVAVIDGDTIRGKMFFEQVTSKHAVKIKGKIKGLSLGEHGMHVHEFGDVTSGCSSTGAHLNPYNKNHGGPKDEERHLGDLGNIVADERGIAKVNMKNKSITLYGEDSILGRSLVVHYYPDDLGKNILEEQSRTTGNSGSRIGCGIIGLTTRKKSRSPRKSSSKSGSNSSRGSKKSSKSRSASRESRKKGKPLKESSSSKASTKSRTASRGSRKSTKLRKLSRHSGRRTHTRSPESGRSKKFKEKEENRPYPENIATETPNNPSHTEAGNPQ